MNHAVLYVSDVERTKEFYTEALGFRVITEFPGAAFFQAPASTNDHDLGVFEIGSTALPSEAGRRTVGLYHLAWEVETLGDLERLAGVLAERKALVGASDHGTTKSLYAKDPDGLGVRGRLVDPGPPDHRARPAAQGHARPVSTSTPRSSASVARRSAVSASRRRRSPSTATPKPPPEPPTH